MEYKRFGNKIVARLDKGEEVLETIKSLCQKENIKLAAFSGIGAVKNATLRYFDPETKKYHDKNFEKSYEAAPIAGNISRMKGEVYLHFHASLGGDDFSSFAGHLKSAVASATFEAVIDVIEGEAYREFSEDIGLNLITFREYS